MMNLPIYKVNIVGVSPQHLNLMQHFSGEVFVAIMTITEWIPNLSLIKKKISMLSLMTLTRAI
jgi:hypothetical protein